MALFSRSLKPGGEAGLPATYGDSDSETNAPRHTVGILLRETRQSYGGEIDRIAALLRIRASYLTAIEDSQYDKLPGPVYAQGFVRAYAVHLGLDGDEAIRRFKQEIAGFEVTRDLSFPVPLAERSIPGGTMVLAALILALCGYGLWYYVSTSDRAHPERVSAVPPDLIAATRPPPIVAPPASPETTAAAPSTTPAPAIINSPAAPPPVPAPPAPTVTVASAVAPPPAPVQTAATPVPASGQIPAAPTPPVAATATAATPQAQAASAPATPPKAPVTDASGFRVYGAPTDVPVRIVVRAVKDSWVQVSAGTDVLIQRTLHPGDTIRVPDQGGLALRTGNGAGIQFEIDGKLFKPLSGTVRTVVLDAGRLATNNGAPPRAE